MSAEASPSERKLAPASATAASVLSKSRVDLAKQSSLVTISDAFRDWAVPPARSLFVLVIVPGGGSKNSPPLTAQWWFANLWGTPCDLKNILPDGNSSNCASPNALRRADFHGLDHCTEPDGEGAMHLVAVENGSQLVAAIVLAGIILYELRAAVIALNNTERYYTAFTLVLASAFLCIAVLSR